MATITISDASRRSRISRQTIYNRINEGKLSVEKDRAGGTIIDVAELLRVFGEPAPVENHDHREQNLDVLPDHLSLAHQLEIERLRSENLQSMKEYLESQVHALQAKIERLEQKEDAREMREAEREKRLLLALEAVSTTSQPITRKLMNWFGKAGS